MPDMFGLLNPGDIIAGSSGLPTSDIGLWGWAALAGMALIVSAAILAFLYVWGTLFRNPQLNAYVKQELYELIVTAIMVPMIFGAVAAMGTLTLGDFVPGGMIPAGSNPSTTIYDASAAYFQQVDTDMSGWLQMNYVMNMYVDQVASVTPYARPLGVGLVSSPMAGLASPLKQLLYNMSVALSLAFIINYAQLVVYIFSLQAFLNYYLPLGIFLRAFTPTRRLGGTLIGVAVAFLFIFPALCTITYTMFYNPATGPLVTFRGLIQQYLTGASNSTDPTQWTFTDMFNNFFGNNFQDSGTSLIDLIGGAFGGIGSLMQNIVGGAFLMLMIFPISVIAWAFAIGFIVPAFNIIVFTQAARGLSKSFGDEVDISSLTRMI